MAHDVKEWRRGHAARLTKGTAVRRLGKMASIGMIRAFWHSCDGGKVNFPRALADRVGHGCRHRCDGRSSRRAGLLVPGGINGPYPAADKRNALCLRRSWRRRAVLVMECRDADAQRHDAEVRRGCGHSEGAGKPGLRAWTADGAVATSTGRRIVASSAIALPEGRRHGR